MRNDEVVFVSFNVLYNHGVFVGMEHRLLGATAPTLPENKVRTLAASFMRARVRTYHQRGKGKGKALRPYPKFNTPCWTCRPRWLGAGRMAVG